MTDNGNATPVGARVKWALAADPPSADEIGAVVELEEWDEPAPVDETPGTRTRVEWDSGIREWVFTSDLILVYVEEPPR